MEQIKKACDIADIVYIMYPSNSHRVVFVSAVTKSLINIPYSQKNKHSCE